MILVILGLGIVIAIVSRGPVSTRVGGTTPIVESPRDTGPHLSLLIRMIRDGDRPSDWLVSCAVSEAWEMGNWQLADKLANAFSPPPAIAAAQPEENPAEATPPNEPIAFKKQSPLDGVKDDEWNDFVTSLAMEPADYDTDRHRGIFHHSKRRLNQLGIDPSTLVDTESQYEAFVKDVSDIKSKHTKMLNSRVTEIVTVDGTDHVLTQSGMLALLKTGGPKGAEKWLSEPEERSKYPKTTEIFLRANGIF